MKLFSLALLVGGASTAFGYSIDESCNACGATERIKTAVAEAKAVLKYAAQVSTACAGLKSGDDECPDNRLRDITRNLLGDVDSDTYTKIKSKSADIQPSIQKN